MKRSFWIVLLLAAGFARADDLGDASRLLQAKAYDQALPAFQRLAEAGNANAQLRLGEMFWFGEGTAPDLARARQWFQRAAAAGNADAAASLASLKRRATHGDEIVYWTSTYRGEDMSSGKFDCRRPSIPAKALSGAEVADLQGRLDRWRACYNGFAANINAALPAGKRIPAEVIDMMTPAEALRAQHHVDAVYAALIQKARTDAAQVDAEEHAWLDASSRSVAQLQGPDAMARSFINSAPFETHSSLAGLNDAMKMAPPAPRLH